MVNEHDVEGAGEVLRAGEYFLAVQGLAMIRRATSRPSVARGRVEEMRRVLEHFDEFPNSLEFPVSEHDVEDGYAKWAPNYDGPNLAIDAEGPIVREMLSGLPPGDALDAACGTGRHASLLAELGHRVIGVDTTEAMLAVARAKVPAGDFRRGRLESLPVDDASVDVLTCALALEHVADLGPVFREFARVMRPGGQAVISDMHPMFKTTGGVAAFPSEDGRRGIPFVSGTTHQISDYVQAFLSAGFSLRGCVEPTVGEETLALFPAFGVYPEATRQAFLGLPFVVVWHLER
jgi:ubiquinone/menaquinone biosynthesis C-methylase UbiE